MALFLQYGDTPLHTAVYWGETDVAQVLLKAGADAKSTDKVHVVMGMLSFVQRWYDDATLTSQGGVDFDQQHHLFHVCVNNAGRLHFALLCCVPSNLWAGGFLFCKGQACCCCGTV